MKVKVQGMDSYEARIARTFLPEDGIERIDGIRCEGSVDMTYVKLAHKSEAECNRPYLLLSGEVNSLKGDFGNGITEVLFGDDSKKPTVDYWYDFSNEELSEMCKLGLFDPGFKCPEMFYNSTFEMPVTCDVVSVKGTEAPVLFVRIDNAHNMSVNVDTCGYLLGQYFEAPVIDETHAKVEDYMDNIEDYISDDKSVQAEEKSTDARHEKVSEDVRVLRRILRKVEDHVVTKAEERIRRISESPVPEIPLEESHEIVEDIREEIREASIEESLRKAEDDADAGYEVQDISVRGDGGTVYGDQDEEPVSDDKAESVAESEGVISAGDVSKEKSEDASRRVSRRRQVSREMQEIADASDKLDEEDYVFYM